MTFVKDEIIESSIILDILKLTMLVYYFKVDFIFDLNNDTSTLLKNINFNELKLPNLQKNIFREICKNSPHGKLVHFYDNKNNDLQAGITISHTYKRISVVFRGTSSKMDWLHSLSFCKTKLFDNIYVHAGFHKQLTENNFCKNIIRDLEALSNIYQDYHIYVAGHSGGGALACLFAYIFSIITKNMITVISFASPRVGNQEWYKKFNKKENIRHYRVINNRDLVTAIPYINYYHVGNTLLLSDNDIYIKKYDEKNDTYLNWCCCSYSINDHALEKYYHKMVLLNIEGIHNL